MALPDHDYKRIEMPMTAVYRWLTPVRKFLHVQAASGLVLLGCTVLALLLANSGAAEEFASFWKAPFGITLGPLVLDGDVGHLLINDGLMAIFFFVVGLEIKREMTTGELREPRKALLPVFAAIGGMIAPALVYLALQWGEPGQRGWAIPMATDIAFVVGFLALFGPRVPFQLRILLLTLAIVDDLGAVLIIALVFSDSIAGEWLAVAAGGFALTYVFNLIGVRQVAVYVAIGTGIWLAFYKAGVHPTVAGVLLGLLTPTSAWIGEKAFLVVIREMWDRLRSDEGGEQRQLTELSQLQFAAREAVSPLQRLETALHPWVAFVIMPLFALANAGVPIELSGLRDPIALAVAAGLAIGKPIGILGACWLAVKLRLSQLPDGVGWPLLTGGACLGGIGFTMALFLNGLAFPGSEYPAAEAAGKIGTLSGSLVSAVLGAILIGFALKRKL